MDGQKSYRILTSGHSVVALCINLQHPHILATDEDKNSSRNGKEGFKVTPLLEEVLALMAPEGGRVTPLCNVATGRFPMTK